MSTRLLFFTFAAGSRPRPRYIYFCSFVNFVSGLSSLLKRSLLLYWQLSPVLILQNSRPELRTIMTGK